MHKQLFPGHKKTMKKMPSSEKQALLSSWMVTSMKLENDAAIDQAIRRHRKGPKKKEAAAALWRLATANLKRHKSCMLKGTSGPCGALRSAYKFAWEKNADGDPEYPEGVTFVPAVWKAYEKKALDLARLQKDQERQERRDTWDREDGGQHNEDALDETAQPPDRDDAPACDRPGAEEPDA